MECQRILFRISEEYNRIFKSNLVGIYIHGSIAFGCFNPNKSDIDFLVVVRNEPTLEEKEKAIKILLELSCTAPQKGFEMSVVRLAVCKRFVYPTPFDLHFSNAHLKKCQEDLKTYCETMNGTDRDLAAHFTVIKKVGITLYGEEINNLFADIPKEYYIDSIKVDVKNAKDAVYENSTYIILNLCRVLAYLTENLILSKEQGGLWGATHLPARFTELIQSTLNNYLSNKTVILDKELLYEFCDYMNSLIFKQ